MASNVINCFSIGSGVCCSNIEYHIFHCLYLALNINTDIEQPSSFKSHGNKTFELCLTYLLYIFIDREQVT